MTILRVALIAGPQYDGLLPRIDDFTKATGISVDVSFQGDHSTLNAHLASALPAGSSYDLVSTHSKYAPSQAQWLTPLDDEVEVASFRPAAMDLCRFHARLFCLPRNIDARLLWLRRDLLGDAAPPTSWDDLLNLAASIRGASGFAFPAHGSGLFGTFFELAVAFGGRLFDDDARPQFDCDGARRALQWLVTAHRERRVTPPDLASWYFDEVSAGFRKGRVAMIGDWPGYYGLLLAAGGHDVAVVARYPSGPAGRSVYAGCHGFAIPIGGQHRPQALQLLAHLTSHETATTEAARGMVPARSDVSLPVAHDLDRRRANLLDLTIAEDLLTFPPLADYPEIEDAASAALRAAVLGEVSAADALTTAQTAAEQTLSN